MQSRSIYEKVSDLIPRGRRGFWLIIVLLLLINALVSLVLYRQSPEIVFYRPSHPDRSPYTSTISLKIPAYPTCNALDGNFLETRPTYKCWNNTIRANRSTSPYLLCWATPGLKIEIMSPVSLIFWRIPFSAALAAKYLSRSSTLILISAISKLDFSCISQKRKFLACALILPPLLRPITWTWWSATAFARIKISHHYRIINLVL